MQVWLDCLREEYGGDLKPDDYIFPAFNQHAKLQRGIPATPDAIQLWISEFTADSGISPTLGQFTTHCFRRGGAQYRFMFAPVGKRWSLRTVRWWGGWATGEHVSSHPLQVGFSGI